MLKKWNGKFRGKAVSVGSMELPATAAELPTFRLAGGMQITVLAPLGKRLFRLRKQWVSEIEKLHLVPGRAGEELIGHPEEEEVDDTVLGEVRLESARDIDQLAQATFHEDGSLANGSSIVLLAEHDGKRCLLGGDAYAAVGVGKSRGTKAVCLDATFARPGLYEVPLGISLRDLVDRIGGGLKSGRAIKALQIGGPLGGIVPASLFDTPFGFEELDAVGGLLGHGGVVAFDETTDMRDTALHLFEFGDDESCGKCFPCRIGMRRGRELVRGLVDGSSDYEDPIGLLTELCDTMQLGSLCAHGGGLPAPIRSVLTHFPGELLAPPKPATPVAQGDAQ